MITDKDREDIGLCPFCGGKSSLEETSTGYGVICWKCQISTTSDWTKEKAKLIWNTRAESPDHALKPALDLLHAMGVSEERIGKDVCRGIDVLSTRYRKELAAVAYNSAEEARKEAEERVRKEFGAQEGGSNTIDRVCSAILGNSAPVSTDTEKLAIAVKALEEIEQIGSWVDVRPRSFDIARDALKEINE